MRDKTFINNIIEEIHDYNIDVACREIYLHGHISDADSDPGVDYRMASTFIKNLRFLNNQSSEEIFIHQYSIGGGWEAGMAIFDMIKQSRCHITMVLHGEAITMGSIVPQAADTRLIMPNAMVLIHEGQTDTVDMTIKQARSHHEWIEKTNNTLFNIYFDACRDSSYFKGQSDIKVKNFLRKKLDQHEDWILSAEDALNFGFVDGIIGSDKYPSIVKLKQP